MDIGKQITNIRKEHKMTQEEFGKLFHVTRQTVSNWKIEKVFPTFRYLWKSATDLMFPWMHY